MGPMMTDTDVEILNMLDFESHVVCAEPDGCKNEAEWIISWKCGCIRPYCTKCRNMVQGYSDRGRVGCTRHGLKRGENHIILILPLS